MNRLLVLERRKKGWNEFKQQCLIHFHFIQLFFNNALGTITSLEVLTYNCTNIEICNDYTTLTNILTDFFTHCMVQNFNYRNCKTLQSSYDLCVFVGSSKPKIYKNISSINRQHIQTISNTSFALQYIKMLHFIQCIHFH